MSVLGDRLRQARVLAGLSQEQLGIEAGLDPMSASARMNRYELGKRTPDFSLVERIAEVLRIPAPFFYASDDEVASLLLEFSKLDTASRKNLVSQLLATSMQDP